MTIDQPIVTGEPDAELMRLIAEFEATYAAGNRMRETYHRERDRITALPDCPPDVLPITDRESYECREDFLDRHGTFVLSNEMSKLSKFAGVIAYQIFATPAHTLVGTVEKLKILRLAYGERPHEGDDDLACYACDSVEMRDESWFASVMKDFERLCAAPPESRVAAE